MNQLRPIDRKIEHVMFVDDDQATNDIHRIICERYGLAQKLTFHTSAKSVLEEFKGYESTQEFPEIIFIDLIMHPMDGHALAAAIKELPNFNPDHSCAVVLTGSRNMMDVLKADESIMKCYFWKPLCHRQLDQVLAEVKE